VRAGQDGIIGTLVGKAIEFEARGFAVAMADEWIQLPGAGSEVRVRYVILRHTGVEREHYDLMVALPGEERLVTWRVFSEPGSWAEHPPTAERIADHRWAYLKYEGEISGGRGNVRQVAEGSGALTVFGDHCRLSFLIPAAGQMALNTIRLPLLPLAS